MSGGSSGPTPEQRKLTRLQNEQIERNNHEAKLARIEYFQMKLKQMRTNGAPNFNVKSPTNKDFIGDRVPKPPPQHPWRDWWNSHPSLI